MADVEQMIAANLARVRERIADAAQRAGRSADDVTLVAVTKYVNAEIARAVAAAGVRDLGESRPQQLWAKAAALNDLQVNWHLVGSLQRNKVRPTIEVAQLIHSLDSTRLADAIHAEAAALGRMIDVLVEVNVSGDATKHGVAPEAAEALLAHAALLPHVRIRGLMAMSHREGDDTVKRRDFARLRALRDHLRSKLPPSVELCELSMGMSDDFELAILEGATMVRVGSALFHRIASSK